MKTNKKEFWSNFWDKVYIVAIVLGFVYLIYELKKGM